MLPMAQFFADTQSATMALPRIGGGGARLREAAPKLIINGRFLVQQATGVQRVARELTLAIDDMLERMELCAEVTLLVPPGTWIQDLTLRSIKVEIIGRFGGFWWEQLVLPCHVGGRRLLCLGNSAPALNLLSRQASTYVMIHDVSFLDHPKAYKFAYRQAHRRLLPIILRGARHIMTVSLTERDRLVRLDPRIASKITVAQNGGWSDHDGDAEAEAPKALDRYALYVGSLSHRKNFPRILASAIRMAREDGLNFVFVGSAAGILHRPECTVPADVAGKIHFLGQVNDSRRLAQIYKSARVLVFPSLYEASPLPPVEAAHFGCPVVVSNIPSMWERCGQDVVYCNPLSVDSIVRAVRSVLRNDDQAAGGQRNDTLSQRYSWSLQAKTICSTIIGTQEAEYDADDAKAHGDELAA